MRLTEHEKLAIKESIASCFGPQSRVFLFGSRINDTKKGGDIDLLVTLSSDNSLDESSKINQKFAAMSQIQRKIGDQKIDLILADDAALPDDPLVVRLARQEGVVL